MRPGGLASPNQGAGAMGSANPSASVLRLELSRGDRQVAGRRDLSVGLFPTKVRAGSAGGLPGRGVLEWGLAAGEKVGHLPGHLVGRGGGEPWVSPNNSRETPKDPCNLSWKGLGIR